MKFFTELGKLNTFLRISLNILRWVGYLVADDLSTVLRKLLPFYGVMWFILSAGIMTILQICDLIKIWGDIPLMVETSYLLSVYFVYILKISNLVLHRKTIVEIVNEGDQELEMEDRGEGKAIIEKSNRDTKKLLYLVVIFYGGSVFGWGATEDKELLFRAWYPFNVTKTPAYELAYVHQSIAIMLLSITNGSMDMLVICLVAVCRCRLSLLKLSMETLFQDINTDDNRLLSMENYKTVEERLRSSVIKHQWILNSAAQIEICFTYSVLPQFIGSIFVLCVSAYQLSGLEMNNKFRLAFMFSYLIGMVVQVFVYCYQGNYLSEESLEIAETVYETPWYVCPIPIRRCLLIMMTRSRRSAELSAGGFATLSLACFMSILKASYSFLTVLQQVQE